MATVNDLIVRAMQIIGALSTGQTPSSDDAQVCFTNLNEMLDGWNTERLNLYVPLPFSGNLLNTQQSYAIGPSAADFPTTNSVALIQTAATIFPATSVRTPMAILNSEEWARLSEKGLTGYLPDKMWCDYGNPIANILVHPIPNHTIAIELYLWTILAQFIALTDTVAFRPGYFEAMAYNLALKIAPQFGLAQDGTNVQLAGTYKQRMQDLNKLAGFPVSPMQQAMPSQGQGGAPGAPPAQ
jgi:hypothetical protein